MRKKLARVLATVLALVMIAALVASCSSGVTSGTTGSTSGTTGSPGVTTAGTTKSSSLNAKLDKTVKLRVCNTERTETLPFEAGATAANNQFLTELKVKTGYANLEFDLLPGASYNDTIKLSIASGDTYDLMYNADWKTLSKQGVLLEITDLLKDYGPEIMDDTPDDTLAAAKLNGRLYCIPARTHVIYKNMIYGNAFVVRKDITDKLGLKMPATTDEMYTFLKAIKAAGYIPYVAGANGQPFSGLEVFTAAFGCASGSFIVKDGQLVDMREQQRFKDCLTYLNKLYSEGLIDNEYLFNTTAKAQEKITSSKAVCAYDNPTNIYNYKNAMSGKVPEVKFSFAAPVKGPEGLSGYSQSSPVGNTMCIPNNAKYPKQAIDLVNTYYGDRELQKYIVFGKEGRDYTIDAAGNMKPTDNYNKIKYKLNFRLLTTFEDWQQLVVLTGCQPECDDFVATGAHCTAFNIENYMPTSEAQAEYGTAQKDLFNEYVAKIITGALPVSAVADFLKAADANGRQDILTQNRKWFTEYGQAIYKDLNK